MFIGQAKQDGDESKSWMKGGCIMGKKHRNRVNSPKKNNHIPEEGIIAEHEAHGKEYTANKRKNGPGHHTD